MKRILIFLFASMLILSLASKFWATQNDTRKQIPITPLLQVVPQFRTPALPNSPLVERLRLVLRDREAWVTLWNQLCSMSGPERPPVPEIDFSREMLIVAAMGQQPTSGYSIIIEAVYANERTHQYEVVVRNSDRSKCNGQATVITSPVDIVRLPRSDYTLVFREKQDATCGPLYSPTTPQ